MIIVKKKTMSHLSNDIISSTTKYAKRQFTWFNNRYKPQIKIDSYKKIFNTGKFI